MFSGVPEGRIKTYESRFLELLECVDDRNASWDKGRPLSGHRDWCPVLRSPLGPGGNEMKAVSSLPLESLGLMYNPFQIYSGILE